MKSRISVINNNPVTQMDLEKYLNPMYKVRKTKIDNDFQFDDEINHEGAVDERSKSILKNIGKKYYFILGRTSKGSIAYETLEITTFNSWLATIMSVINSIIRYTVIQLPYCMQTLGLLWGTTTIMIIALISLYSVFLLVRVSQKTGERY